MLARSASRKASAQSPAAYPVRKRAQKVGLGHALFFLLPDGVGE